MKKYFITIIFIAVLSLGLIYFYQTRSGQAVSKNTQASQTPLPAAIDQAAQEPLAIDVMRHKAYPGSDLVIEQKLFPGVNYDQFIASYRSDGLKIYGLLTVPQGTKPSNGWPVIIFNHGYIQPDLYKTTERYVAYVAALAKSGYIVFKPDFRGNGNSEG